MCIGGRKKQIKTIKTTLFLCACVYNCTLIWNISFPLKKKESVSIFSCPFLTIVWIIAEEGLEANFLIIQKSQTYFKKTLTKHFMTWS